VSEGSRTSGQGSRADLANTLTHEFGHLVGLDHTCWDQGGTPGVDDSSGQQIPRCEPASALSSEVKEATMYNFQDPGETKKRTVEEDDIDGFCAIYPDTMGALECRRAVEPDDGCGCRVGGSPRPVAGSLMILGLALGLLLVQGWHGTRKR
jgi:hypothetical protein